MRKTTIFLFSLVFSVLIVFISCSETIESPKIEGEWSFVRMKFADRPNASMDFEREAFKSSIAFSDEGTFLMAYRYKGYMDPFSIFQENNDSLEIGLDRREVLWGNWEFSKADSALVLVIKNMDKKPLDFTLKNVENSSITLSNEKILGDAFNAFQIQFRSSGAAGVSVDENNYLSPKYNTWRIPSSRKETKDEIRQRIKNAFDFAVVFMKFHQSKEESVDTQFIHPLPLYFAANGLRSNRNKEWEDLFYDDEDVVISYQILEEVFDFPIDIPDGLNGKPVSLNIFILEEMAKNIVW